MKYLEVDLGKLRANLAVVQERAGDAKVIAVVKGNAYGLGLVPVSKALRDGGVKCFAVTEAADGATLRREVLQNGEEILLLCSTCDKEYLSLAAEHDLTVTIGSPEAAQAASVVAQAKGVTLKAHVEVDTGMGRYGFLPEEYESLRQVYETPSLQFTGIYTHFYCSFGKAEITRGQCERFSAVLGRLQADGVAYGTVHAANSCALFRFDFCKYDAVRVGSCLTGRLIAGNGKKLQRVGEIVCDVAEARTLQKGCTTGYGGLFRAKKATPIAVLPVGYADGFCAEKGQDDFSAPTTLRYMVQAVKRFLHKERIWVTVNGKKVPAIGHVGMLHTTVDMTGKTYQPGDEARMSVNPIFVGDMERRYIHQEAEV